MTCYLFFLGGVILGTVITRLVFDILSVTGDFKIVEPDDDYPQITIRVENSKFKKLLKTNCIVLYKEESHK